MGFREDLLFTLLHVVNMLAYGAAFFAVDFFTIVVVTVGLFTGGLAIRLLILRPRSERIALCRPE